MTFIVGEDLVKKMFYSKYNLKKKIKIFFFYLKKKNKMLVILVIDESIVQFVVVVAVIIAAVVDFRISILRWCVQHAPRLRHGREHLQRVHHGELQTQRVLFLVYFFQYLHEFLILLLLLFFPFFFYCYHYYCRHHNHYLSVVEEEGPAEENSEVYDITVLTKGSSFLVRVSSGSVVARDATFLYLDKIFFCLAKG
jgi:hypothetical protein